MFPLPALLEKKEAAIEKNKEIEKLNATPTKAGKPRKPRKLVKVPTDEEINIAAFNTNSSKQLKSIFYDKEYYALPWGRAKALRTPKGDKSTGVKAIEYFRKTTLSDAQFKKREEGYAATIDREIPKLMAKAKGDDNHVVEKIQALKKSQRAERERFQEARQFTDALLKHRRMAKMKSTYINPVPMSDAGLDTVTAVRL